MANPGSLEVISGTATAQATVLGVDLPSGGRRAADFAGLGARIAEKHRYLQVKPPDGRPDRRLPADAYIAAWVTDIQRDERPVRAVLGHRVGSMYAAEIADCISRWQDPPLVILLDPQVPTMRLLGGELHRDISALSSLLSDDEIERARKIAVEVSETEAPDIAVAAAEIVENYLEAITAAFERAGLGAARGNKLTTPFEWYISWLSAADKLDLGHAWRRSTVLTSSNYSGLPDLISRRIPVGVDQADLLRSDSVANAILDLLDCEHNVLGPLLGRQMSILEIANPITSSGEYDLRDPLLRLAQLFDGNDYALLHRAAESEVRTAVGRINGARAVAYCTDATKMGGALGNEGSQRIVEAIEVAVRERSPVVGIWHSGGAKLADGVESMDAVGRMFAAMTRASGRVPQISIVVGPAAGAAAYGPALTDVIIMAPAGRVFITGPDVVKSVTGEQIDMEGLGGPEPHSRNSGVAHITADSEPDAYLRARRLVAFFACPGRFDWDRLGEEQDLRSLLPASPRRAYEVRPLVRAILDADGGFDELQPRWAPNMVIGLGRLAGRTIGVVANNPIRKGGCLDSLSAEKASRFVRMCDSLGVPILVLVDVPGYLPGVGQEWNGVVRRGAKLLHAFAEATVPRVTLVTRKSYGGAYIALNSRALGATSVFAWPEAEIAVMGAEAAVGILHRKKLAAAAEHERDALKNQLIAEQTRIAGGPDRAMAIGVLDEVIPPSQTRRRLAEAFASAPAGRGYHGNIPL